MTHPEGFLCRYFTYKLHISIYKSSIIRVPYRHCSIRVPHDRHNTYYTTFIAYTYTPLHLFYGSYFLKLYYYPL